MLLRECLGVAGVLDGIFRLGLNKYCRRWNALRGRNRRHHVRFDEAIVRSSAREDQPWRNSTVIFPDGLRHPSQLRRRRVAIVVRRSSEHNDRIEVIPAGVLQGREPSGNERPPYQSGGYRRCRRRSPQDPAALSHLDGPISTLRPTRGCALSGCRSCSQTKPQTSYFTRETGRAGARRC